MKLLQEPSEKTAYMREYTRRRQETSPLIPCECGCETMIHSINTMGKPARFAFNHHSRGNQTAKKHGMHATSTYRSWQSMKQRCLNPKATGYEYWGGRGVTVCDRWMEFESFLADMGERPEGTSLDRIDNDGPYAPENCHWATSKQQASNRRPI